jgi:hypothetical protein
MNLPKTTEELYILKNDLEILCKKYNLPTSGSKENLLEYLSNYIENKPVKKLKLKSKVGNNDFEPSLDKIIDENYSNNEIHRAFFQKAIGNNFKFNVKFMNWINMEKNGKMKIVTQTYILRRFHILEMLMNIICYKEVMDQGLSAECYCIMDLLNIKMEIFQRE